MSFQSMGTKKSSLGSALLFRLPVILPVSLLAFGRATGCRASLCKPPSLCLCAFHPCLVSRMTWEAAMGPPP